jgi:hypothetical protein
MHVVCNSDYQFFESDKRLVTRKFILVAIAAAVDQEVDQEECGSFVAVDEAVIPCDRLYKGRRLPMDRSVVAGIRSADS